jgi:hypothetical protein
MSSNPAPHSGQLSSSMGLTTWRSHEGLPGLHPPQPQTPGQPPTQQMQEPMPPQQTPIYHTPAPTQERGEWSTPQSTYQYPIHPDAQRPHQYDAQPPPNAALPPPQNYIQTPAQAYNPPPPPPPQHPTSQPSYHPPQLPPQTEFQNMAVSSPATYQVQQLNPYQQQHPSSNSSYQTPQAPPAYSQSAPIQMTSTQMPASVGEYSTTHLQMQPPPVPATTYNAPPAEQQFAPPQIHPPMQYPSDGTNRSYSLVHYPSG